MSFISRQRWRISIASVITLLALMLSLGYAVASRGQSHAAEPLTQISSDPYTNTTSNHKTQVEPDTFAFGKTIVATFQSGRFFDGGASNIGFATSTNAGETWTHGFLPSSTVYASPPGIYLRASDPSVAYDAKHKVWIISWLGIKSPSGPVDVLVSRSTNGGLTWGKPVVVNKTGHFNDKNWSVCDDSASSPFFGNCYTEFDNASAVNLVQMSTSTDGGKSWSRTVLAAQILFDGDPGGIRSGPLPTAEIDKSGRVYVVWTDCRFEARCSAPIGTNDLVLISSADGIHWTLPKRIPTAPVGSGADRLIPGLAVDRSTSGSSAHLGLAYYFYPNSNCTTSTCQLDVGFISSTNGGASWSAPEQLAGPMQLTWLPLTTLGYMVGDYISTSIVPGDDDATPVFEVAFAPTPPPNCSDPTTGAPGSGCHEATYTTPEDVLKITGGANVSRAVAPANLRKPSRLS